MNSTFRTVIAGLVMSAGPVLAADLTVSGEAMYQERMLLPPGAMLEVRLEDQSRADAPAMLVARTERQAFTSPTAFTLTFDAERLTEGHAYGWRATIRLDDELLFTTDTMHSFDPGVTTGLTLPMVRVTQSSGEPLALVGRWLAEDIGGRGVIDNAQTTLEIAESGRLTGSGGCNRFSGQATLGETAFAAGPVAATQMSCSPALMDQEQKFFAALAATSSFQIDSERRKLTLIDAMGHPKATLSRMD